MRNRFQGVGNIVRFNWPMFLGALIAGFAAVSVAIVFEGGARLLAIVFVALAGFQVLLSLAVSYFVYDRSGLYDLEVFHDWIEEAEIEIVSIHAGFDETSGILRRKFPNGRLEVWDFYDPQKHTEPSIRRARAVYPPDSKQVRISTRQLPAPENRVDLVTLIFSAHEIRNPTERDDFFAEVYRILNETGRVIVIEHLRDIPNFLAYSVGAFHFLSRGSWMSTWRSAGLEAVDQKKITHFVTAFLLQKT